MTIYQGPILAAIAAQRQQELQHEAKGWHAANVAESANKESNGWPWTQLKGVAARIHFVSAHRLSGAARRAEFRLSARRETPLEAWSE